VITNDVSESYQYSYVIAHIICNHPVLSFWRYPVRIATVLPTILTCLEFLHYNPNFEIIPSKHRKLKRCHYITYESKMVTWICCEIFVLRTIYQRCLQAHLNTCMTTWSNRNVVR